MRYVYLTNGRVGSQILHWLVARGDRPVGIVVHPVQGAKYRNEILDVVKLPPEDILEGPVLRTPEGISWLTARQPDWLLSVYFGYILQPDVLAIPLQGALNLHPALLPFNRGAYPNVWSIVEHTPAGVTLHFIEAGVDTGDIVAQRLVSVSPMDTGATLYAKLEEVAVSLFQEVWPTIVANSYARKPQQGAGTFHRVRDIERIDRIEPNQLMRAGELIDVIRACTFPPYKGAYLDLGDRRVYLSLELTEESQ